MLPEALQPDEVEALRRLTSCQVADAIETLEVRLRNVGFMDSSVQSMMPALPPMVGYAVTARFRTAEPPMTGRAYPTRTDWWTYLQTVPAPRIVVMEDLDRHPGRGSCAGEVHAHIFRALGCSGLITNGAVRDLQAAEAIGFPYFAGNVIVSHGYFHLLEFDLPVEVGGLVVRPGDLLHGDRHGVIQIPPAVARQLPAAAQRVAELERRVLEVADSPHPSLADLRRAVLESVNESNSGVEE